MKASTRSKLMMLRRKVAPWVIWGLCAATSGWIYTDLKTGPAIIGFAYGIEYPVAPLEASRVSTVAVEVGQEVIAGQVIAILDGTEVEREIAVAEARRARVEAELMAAVHRARRAVKDRQRELQGQRARLEARLAEVRATVRVSAAELRSQRIEQARLKALVDARLVDRSQLAAVEARVATLKARVGATRQAVTLLETRVEEAQAYVDTATDEHVEIEVGPIRRKLDLADAEIASLRSKRASLVLRAPADGRVASVDLHAGGVASATEKVVTLVGDGGGRVIACITEEQALDVRVGDGATLHPRQVGARTLKGHVVGLGPLVDRLPSRCRPNVRERAWGRDVVILVDEAVDFLPGQALDVRLEQDDDNRGALAAAPRQEPGALKEIKVPGMLKRRSRFEPSGLVWVPRLVRYVVVSDDTGRKDGNAHAPWIFTMDTKGRVDRVPLALVGVESLNDLEALARGPGDVLYALSSQSHSKSGKRSTTREQFLRLVPEGGGYRVNGVVHLASLLDAASDDVRQRLGISDTSALDLEGLTTHEGGLLIGVKHPLDDQDRAMVWRIDRPDRLFDTGRLDDAGLVPWGVAAMTVQADGHQVPAGISELLSLP
ncbi:MAG: biotin/lipoyl-binding protein, partial [Myxococcota bacterium]|nr:biotin/lipoyl-binding protein [Myxococcota bacterium]